MESGLAAGGARVISGGTDNHLALVDVTPLNIGGKLAEEVLDQCGITVNKNMIPFDERKPMDPSGIRIGAPALTSRGMGTEEMKKVAAWMLDALQNHEDPSCTTRVRDAVREMCKEFPTPAAGGLNYAI